MSHIDFFLLECHLHLCRQLQESEIVGNGSTAFAHTLGNFFLGHSLVFQKMFVCKCNLYGVEVLALDILHERHLHHVFIADGADVGRYCHESSQL